MKEHKEYTFVAGWHAELRRKSVEVDMSMLIRLDFVWKIANEKQNNFLSRPS